ncbi:putative LysM domain peptidoglycan-binding protein [Modestobacter italicus]|uniref:LysM domain peptidoglycan-binding protein n=1 Tax=Modestobacter italicus (strain DSM 44449 / CECT 9708 / BC 501) TaxID=2732864 RepID=I4EYT6_MODI5|nr:LysM peptidoglycan-binding domain-containing protein [Modestobacter marinus]CCH88549.1 putative LysM domain peptidoglycan-binding protein [Modestobacter marinus]
MSTYAVRLLRAVGALTVLVAIIVGVPVLLTALHLVPHGVPSLDEAVAVLTARDDGRLLQVVLGAGVWVCWALFTASTVAEVAALARARPAGTLPGLRFFRQPVAALLAAVVVGLTVAPAAIGTSSSGATPTRPPLPVAAAFDAAPTLAGATISAPAIQTASAISAPEEVPPTPSKTYEVRRRDTLWALAERYLGDPLRYPEIVQLNPAGVGPDNEIVPGTVLVLPSDATGLTAADAGPTVASAAAHEVTVEPGDTLSGIAAEVAGDARSWQTAWEVNRGRPEPGGAVFSDPDLIRPGWTLTVPAAEGASAETSTAPAPLPESLPDPIPEHAPKPEPEPAPITAEPAGPGTASPQATEPTASRADPSPTRAEAPVEVVSELPAVAFTGGGVLVAGVSLMALLRYRRRQFRHRRPGRLISSTPPELLHVERALQSAGSADVTWLDQALRSLVQELASVEEGRLPDVVAVCMTDDVLTLMLTSSAFWAPEPWTVDEAGTRWSIRRGDPLRYDERRRAHFFAPFPTLASVGSTAGGEHWLLDLERVAAISLTGSTDRGLDLLRFLAAELAHNTWSEMLQVTAVGFGAELAEINPDRFTYTEDVDKPIATLTGRLESVTEAMRLADTDVLTGRLRDIAADAWAPHVLLIGPHLPEGDPALANLLTALERQPSRSGVAVVLATGGDRTDDVRWQLTIDEAGLLRIPALGLELRAQQLPAAEAAPLAQMLALAAVTEDRPVPPAHGERPWEQNADACGGFPAEGADDEPAPRRADPLTARVDSVLPLAEQAYVDVAATTGRDVRALAPVTDDALRDQVQRADPDLDQDLADWADASSPRPKLTLLGPVQVRAQGSLPERNKRRQFYTEIVAYLATRPQGATSERYATAIWPDEPDVIGKTKVRQSISVVRAWLGADPVTGTDYLPSGLTAAAAGRYRIDGILIDAELFRRLRVRGLARGAGGIADLRAALDLVTGRPFDLPLLRQGAAGGYSWLVDGNSRLDHEYAAMIVDVAHTVATHHLASGEPELAAAAAQVALNAGSFEDVPLLDLVAACDAQGNRAGADAYVARILANHDAEVEEDLPPRTADILFRRQRMNRAG